MTNTPVVFNVTHCDNAGLSKARLLHQSIQVCHLKNGNSVLMFSESGRDSVLFDLTPAQRLHFIGLLERATPTATPAQAATETVAGGV